MTIPLLSDRGRDKVWVYGALCVRNGRTLTQVAPSRNTAGYLALRQALDQAHPQGDRYLISDNLSSHASGPILEWLAAHPRMQHAVIPVGASWLNRIAGWLRASSAAQPSPACRWPTPTTWPRSRASPPPSLTATPSPGSGAVRRHHTARFVAALSITFEERRNHPLLSLSA
jgi:DDE superfamily endonuclease